MDKIDKIKLWISLIFRVLLVIAGIMAIFHKDWMNVMLCISTIFLTFLPGIIEKRFKVDYPSEFEIVILVFIYASIYLGEMQSFYQMFWWWDILLHTISGVIIGAIGFSLVYILNREKEVAITLSPLFVAIFSFSFALSIGAVWEIFEFSMDSIFGLNMQNSGLVDTMWDIIVDTLGALFISILGYRYLKGHVNIFKKIEEKIISQNPRLFKKNVKG